MSEGAALSIHLPAEGRKVRAMARGATWEAPGRPRELSLVREDHYEFLEGVKEKLKEYRLEKDIGCLQEALLALRARSETLTDALVPAFRLPGFRKFCNDALAPARAAGRVPR